MDRVQQEMRKRGSERNSSWDNEEEVRAEQRGTKGPTLLRLAMIPLLILAVAAVVIVLLLLLGG